MATKKKAPPIRVPKHLKDLANSTNDTLRDLHAKTYFAPKTDEYDFNFLKDSINQSIDDIMKRNSDINGLPNISNVYSRLINSSKGSSLNGEDADVFRNVFEDQSLMDAAAEAYSVNTYIRQYDNEIDMICRYLPKLDEAIQVKKDTVLCADQFNKEFLNIINVSSGSDSAQFGNEITTLKKKYKLSDLIEESCVRTWKYGEDFLYIIPYKRAFEIIFNHRKNSTRPYDISAPTIQDPAIRETAITEAVSFPILKMEGAKDNEDPGEFSFNVVFNQTNALTESIVRSYNAAEKLQIIQESSYMYGQLISEATKDTSSNINILGNKKLNSNKIIPDDTIPEGSHDYNRVATDGFINSEKETKDKDDVGISKIPGALVKRLERHKVIPVYIEDMCMGYYYVEMQDNDLNDNTKFTTYMDMGQKYGQRLARQTYPDNDPIKNDAMLKSIASKLSAMIDKKFINANQDISRELYMILKYDEDFNQNTKNVRVTFIPPDDLSHIYFRMNPKTHRGISLLDKSLIPAKIYVSLMMTNAVGIMTRGQDKRVYYVKQQVEENISKTLLNAINQIKKGNFGVRNMENLTNVLNITGQYNDYFIPRSSNGDVPVEFEVLQGQNIDPKLEFLQKFEDYAIAQVGVPPELIDARLSVDYALQLSMTNSKYLRIVYKDQSNTQAVASTIITKIYDAEFCKSDILMVMLPPPLYISMTNTSQIISNTLDMLEKVMVPKMQAQGASDQAIQFAKDAYLEQTLGTYTNFELINECIRQGMQNSATEASGATQEQ